MGPEGRSEAKRDASPTWALRRSKLRPHQLASPTRRSADPPTRFSPDPFPPRAGSTGSEECRGRERLKMGPEGRSEAKRDASPTWALRRSKLRPPPISFADPPIRRPADPILPRPVSPPAALCRYQYLAAEIASSFAFAIVVLTSAGAPSVASTNMLVTSVIPINPKTPPSVLLCRS